jgi:hypothetical protein
MTHWKNGGPVHSSPGLQQEPQPQRFSAGQPMHCPLIQVLPHPHGGSQPLGTHSKLTQASPTPQVPLQRPPQPSDSPQALLTQFGVQHWLLVQVSPIVQHWPAQAMRSFGQQ